MRETPARRAVRFVAAYGCSLRDLQAEDAVRAALLEHLQAENHRRQQALADIDRMIEEGTVEWSEIPKGGYSPVRPEGFPGGYETAPPIGYLENPLARPRWIDGSTGEVIRPVNEALRRMTVGWMAQTYSDQCRMKGYLSRDAIRAYVAEQDLDPWDRHFVLSILGAIDYTPRPPLYLYAPSFSLLIVPARRKLYTPPPIPLSVIETGGLIVVELPQVVPVWDLGKVYADARGKVWDLPRA